MNRENRCHSFFRDFKLIFHIYSELQTSTSSMETWEQMTVFLHTDYLKISSSHENTQPYCTWEILDTIFIPIMARYLCTSDAPD